MMLTNSNYPCDLEKRFNNLRNIEVTILNKSILNPAKTKAT